MLNVYFCQWLDSNRGPLKLEAAALPTDQNHHNLFWKHFAKIKIQQNEIFVADSEEGFQQAWLCRGRSHVRRPHGLHAGGQQGACNIFIYYSWYTVTMGLFSEMSLWLVLAHLQKIIAVIFMYLMPENKEFFKTLGSC